ncbi:MFS transporter [Streptomyces sp. NPDC059009]|uniref:MFS transporter n=1 Tax=Streptomyces sp. NPDC059009 TaxID=3346694 RepID=UPI0036A29D7C
MTEHRSSADAATPAGAGATAGATATATTAWRTTWTLLAFMLVNFADKTVMGLAAKPIRHELGLTRGEFGLASAAFFTLFSLAALGVSYLTRTVRTTWLLLGMALLWSAAQLPMLWGAAGFGTLIATRVLLGAAEGPALPVATHHLHGWFTQRERTLPTAVLLTGAAAGVAVAAPTLTLVIDHWGWRWAFGVVGIVGLLWAGYWAVRGEEGPYAPGLATTRGAAPGTAAVPTVSSGPTVSNGPTVTNSPTLPYRRILLTGTWLTAAFGAFAAYWTLSSALTWMPDYFETVCGLTLRQAGLLVTLAALANGVVLLTHGLLVQRRKGRPGRGMAAGALMAVASCALALFAATDLLWLKIVLLLGPMALANVIMTVAQTACARISPPSQRGVVLGALAFVYASAGMLAPWTVGRVVDAAGSDAAGYRTAFLLTAALTALAGVLALCFLRPERQAERLGVPLETPPDASEPADAPHAPTGPTRPTHPTGPTARG